MEAATPPSSQTGVKSTSSPRERWAAKKKGTTSQRARPASPTRAIEVGPVHEKAAELLLQGVQRQAAARGVTLDVGEFPSGSTLDAEDDPQRLARVTAHAIARIADRFPLARRFTRHLEGSTEKRAGLGSDLLAALVTLYRRNPEAIRKLAGDLAADVQSRQQARQGPTVTTDATHSTASPQPSQPTPGGVRHAA